MISEKWLLFVSPFLFPPGLGPPCLQRTAGHRGFKGSQKRSEVWGSSGWTSLEGAQVSGTHKSQAWLSLVEIDRGGILGNLSSWTVISGNLQLEMGNWKPGPNNYPCSSILYIKILQQKALHGSQAIYPSTALPDREVQIHIYMEADLLPDQSSFFLEKGMATHSSIRTWRILWTEEPNRLQSMGSQRVGHTWATNTFRRRFGLPRWHLW